MKNRFAWKNILPAKKVENLEFWKIPNKCNIWNTSKPILKEAKSKELRKIRLERFIFSRPAQKTGSKTKNNIDWWWKGISFESIWVIDNQISLIISFNVQTHKVGLLVEEKDTQKGNCSLELIHVWKIHTVKVYCINIQWYPSAKYLIFLD